MRIFTQASLGGIPGESGHPEARAVRDWGGMEVQPFVAVACSFVLHCAGIASMSWMVRGQMPGLSVQGSQQNSSMER